MSHSFGRSHPRTTGCARCISRLFIGWFMSLTLRNGTPRAHLGSVPERRSLRRSCLPLPTSSLANPYACRAAFSARRSRYGGRPQARRGLVVPTESACPPSPGHNTVRARSAPLVGPASDVAQLDPRTAPGWITGHGLGVRGEHPGTRRSVPLVPRRRGPGRLLSPGRRLVHCRLQMPQTLWTPQTLWV